MRCTLLEVGGVYLKQTTVRVPLETPPLQESCSWPLHHELSAHDANKQPVTSSDIFFDPNCSQYRDHTHDIKKASTELLSK